MSGFPPQYLYQQQQFFDPSAFEQSQNAAYRSKTPTDSMINHSGLSPANYSPGPLITTPPPLSRHPSQQPVPTQEQVPDQVYWDNGSFSNSPTSVRTPDNVEMLDNPDMRSFYQQESNVMSTQASNNNVPAVDSNMFFSDQGMFSKIIRCLYADEISTS
jgi:hypothetical protein